MGYLKLDIFTCDDSGDCSNGGVSVTHRRNLFIEHSTGPRHDLPDAAIVLELGRAGNRTHLRRGAEKRHVMWGGALAWSSDSRVRELLQHPTPIHDRAETGTVTPRLRLAGAEWVAITEDRAPVTGALVGLRTVDGPLHHVVSVEGVWYAGDLQDE